MIIDRRFIRDEAAELLRKLGFSGPEPVASPDIEVVEGEDPPPENPSAS